MRINSLLEKLQKAECFFGIIAVIIYAFTAYYSLGYYHPDEHFQIIEFADFKIGKISSADLPWEYVKQIRSSLQPWIAFLLIKILSFFNITNVYFYAFCLRLLTAFLSLFATFKFMCSNIRSGIVPYRIGYILLSYFLWYLPFLSVRFSSESWSGIFFLLAASYIEKDKKLSVSSSIKIGIFMGVSFLCRFQSGVMLFGLFMWFLFIRKVDLKIIIRILASWVFIVALGIVIDRLFYGDWIVSFWNYFNINILQNIASNFGTEVWYNFLSDVVNIQILPLGILVFMCVLLLLFEETNSLLIWCIMPLFICHLIIPHKEVRFLFPLSWFVPLLLIRGIYRISTFVPQWNIINRLSILLFSLLIFLNFIIMCAAALTVPSYGRIALTKYVHDNFKDRPVVIYSIGDQEDPFVPFSFLNQSFYDMPKVYNRKLDSYNDLNLNLFCSDTVTLLVFHQGELKNIVLRDKIESLHLYKMYGGNLDFIVNVDGFFFHEIKDANSLFYTTAGNSPSY